MMATLEELAERISQLEQQVAALQQPNSALSAAGAGSQLAVDRASFNSVSLPLVLSGDDPQTDRLEVAGEINASGGYVRVRGLGEENAYIGGDGNASDVQIGSTNPSVRKVSLWNPATGNLMGLRADEVSAWGINLRVQDGTIWSLYTTGDSIYATNLKDGNNYKFVLEPAPPIVMWLPSVDSIVLDDVIARGGHED